MSLVRGVFIHEIPFDVPASGLQGVHLSLKVHIFQSGGHFPDQGFFIHRRRQWDVFQMFEYLLPGGIFFFRPVLGSG